MILLIVSITNGLIYQIQNIYLLMNHGERMSINISLMNYLQQENG
jgi:hypothetical protein